MKTKSQIFIKGLLDVLPLLIPVFPFGVIYGVIGMELGLGPYLTFASSFVIFSGSSQHRTHYPPSLALRFARKLASP